MLDSRKERKRFLKDARKEFEKYERKKTKREASAQALAELLEEEEDEDSDEEEIKESSFDDILNIPKNKINDFIDIFHELLKTKEKGIVFTKSKNKIEGKSKETKLFGGKPYYEFNILFKEIRGKIQLVATQKENRVTHYYTNKDIIKFNDEIKDLINKTYKILNIKPE